MELISLDCQCTEADRKDQDIQVHMNTSSKFFASKALAVSAILKRFCDMKMNPAIHFKMSADDKERTINFYLSTFGCHTSDGGFVYRYFKMDLTFLLGY